MADPYLRELVSAAEDEKWLPVIRVVAGNTLFVGTPGSTKLFREKTQYSIGEEHYYSQGRVTKKQSEAQRAESLAYGDQVVTHMVSAIGDSETGDVLTLFDCQIWPASGGDGVRVAVTRIPLAAVDGWWAGAGERLEAPKQGGGWLLGLGVVVPVDQ